MLSKESKIRVLENFYALDYVFFGKPVAQVESCCPLVTEEYLSIKGALMSVFVEMLKIVGHTPDQLDEQVNSDALMQTAKLSARIARENAERIVSTDKSRAAIKETLKQKIKEGEEIDISEAIEGQIRQQAFSLAVDNLLLARVVSESEQFSKLNEWEGTIVEDSYKILRDNLIESAYDILYSESDIFEEDEDKATSDKMAQLEESYDTMLDLAVQDGFIQEIALLEKGGVVSMAVATQYAEWKCGLRGKDKVFKFQLGFRKCYWEHMISYVQKKMAEEKRNVSAKCSKLSDAKAKNVCLKKLQYKLAKSSEAITAWKKQLKKVIDRIAKKKGKTWKA